ncbi:MAG: RdgB/HAM1 family non-canonical purine NTP pyrophosphatase [Bacteroidota bacterium]
MQLLFASSNVNKLIEIRNIIPSGYTLLSLSDMNFTNELEETGETLEENALQKARFVSGTFSLNCFSDDSGLEVTALNNEPGVHSAYYAGLPRNDRQNMELLLKKLDGQSNRNARFRTVIALVLDGKEYIFEGKLEGTIATEMKGDAGFGYDPLFIPEGYQFTLAEGGMELKNKISHRKKAISQLVLFLEELKLRT